MMFVGEWPALHQEVSKPLASILGKIIVHRIERIFRPEVVRQLTIEKRNR